MFLLYSAIVCGVPTQLYRGVQELLESWPHLVKLFTEFLEPSDCIEAGAVSLLVVYGFHSL